MNLEDEFSDVIAKAMKGLEMDEVELAEQAGVSPCEISGLLHGDMDEAVIQKISKVLKLDAQALIGLDTYTPAALSLPGIQRLELPFRQWSVNAWLLESNGTRILFDTGFGENDLIETISCEELAAVLITHDHPDHIGGVKALNLKNLRIISEVEAMKAGVLEVAGVTIRVVDLSGHKSPAVGYVFEHSGVPVLVAGDAIFAGSMGRCLSQRAYDLAFESLREAFSDLPNHCVILPGHGPATTFGEELTSNPFRSGFR